MSKINTAVVGATGAVGRQMLKILEEKEFPVGKLKLFATEKSKGKKLKFQSKNYEVDTIKKGSFSDIDIALFSIGSTPSKKIAPQAAEEGAVVIDNSNAFRMDEEVPLVVPEINPEEIKNNNGIIANPNCSTIQMVLALKPIYEEAGIKRIVVSTYQAVSGTGKKAIDELKEQVKAYVNGNELKSEVYPHQIAFNVLPHIDVFFENGYTKEELKLVRETKKILNDSQIAISSTAARIPVFYGHAESINVETEQKLEVDRLKELLNSTEGVEVVDDPENSSYPLPINSEHNDKVMVGRIREDFSIKNGINMWVVANNLRKGAALNAVQIAEKIIN
ncbi:MAG: aspartate-semialdehyde dehydrogenase [Bacillota bacterium]